MKNQKFVNKKLVINLLIITDVLSILGIIAILLNSELCNGAIWLGSIIFFVCYSIGVTFFLGVCDSKIRKWIVYIIDLISWL